MPRLQIIRLLKTITKRASLGKPTPTRMWATMTWRSANWSRR
jgi:hypothetical protein